MGEAGDDGNVDGGAVLEDSQAGNPRGDSEVLEERTLRGAGKVLVLSATGACKAWAKGTSTNKFKHET